MIYFIFFFASTHEFKTNFYVIRLRSKARSMCVCVWKAFVRKYIEEKLKNARLLTTRVNYSHYYFSSEKERVEKNRNFFLM